MLGNPSSPGQSSRHRNRVGRIRAPRLSLSNTERHRIGSARTAGSHGPMRRQAMVFGASWSRSQPSVSRPGPRTVRRCRSIRSIYRSTAGRRRSSAKASRTRSRARFSVVDSRHSPMSTCRRRCVPSARQYRESIRRACRCLRPRPHRRGRLPKRTQRVRQRVLPPRRCARLCVPGGPWHVMVDAWRIQGRRRRRIPAHGVETQECRIDAAGIHAAPASPLGAHVGGHSEDWT